MAKKSTPTPKPAEKTAAAPMDPSAAETPTLQIAPNSTRNCYALDTLVAEVTALYPEVKHEPSGYNGRNTALDVTFDVTSVPDDEQEGFTNLLRLVEVDPRVDYVLVADDGLLVSFRANPRTQDSRDTFNLLGAWDVLHAAEGSL